MSIAYDDLESMLKFGLADRLEKALTVSGTKSEDMAEYLDVSRNTISNYINGRTAPRRAILRLWSAKTGVPIEWIETGHFPTSPKSPLSDYQAADPAPVISLDDYRKVSA